MQRWMCHVLVLSVLSCVGLGSSAATLARQNTPEQEDGSAACTLLRPIVPELVGVDLEAVTFRPSSFGPQQRCRATWASPAAPSNRFANEVRLTMVATVHDSAEAAVASLESWVASGGPGTNSGEWVEGVGDRAFQNNSSVTVAAKARRFTVSVSISGDTTARDQERTLDLARSVAGAL